MFLRVVEVNILTEDINKFRNFYPNYLILVLYILLLVFFYCFLLLPLLLSFFFIMVEIVRLNMVILFVFNGKK